MKNFKTILPTIALGIVLGGAGVLATTNASAFFGNREESNKELAIKLGVDESKVSSAMDEIRSQHQEARKVEVSTNLDKAVNDGVITADQKQKVLDHQAQMQGQRQKNRDANQQWAEDNGIDMSKLRSYIGGGRGQQNGAFKN